MNKSISGMYIGSGDTISIEFTTNVVEGSLFISDVDVNTVKAKVADFLCQTFKWIPSAEEVAELINVREATIAKLMRENIGLEDRNEYLERELEILLKIRALINPPEWEPPKLEEPGEPDRKSTGVDDYNG